jgi:cytochrome c peroxidase
MAAGTVKQLHSVPIPSRVGAKLAPVNACCDNCCLFARLNSTTSSRSSESAPPPPPQKSSSTGLILAGIAAAGLGGGFFYYRKGDGASAKESKTVTKTAATATFEDYRNVYDAIAKKVEDEDEWDDGSYAPILLRIAWHSSGSYDKNAGDGGSCGGTMRFETEVNHDGNAGLKHAREFLESVRFQFPWISHGDLYTLAGVCAVQEMGGPTVRWRAGRVDIPESATHPNGRLPDGGKGSDHVRDVFYRMGFNDQEIVALIGAHTVGRCHVDRSGFDGPWTFSPTVFSNDFFKLLLEEKWTCRKWDGPKQLQDSSNSIMMLPADYVLVTDKKFKEWTVKYANDVDLFFEDYAVAYQKLLELGVKFKPSTPEWVFERRNGK